MKFSNPIMIHWVHDMDRAVGFYCALFAGSLRSASPTWSVVDIGAVTIALHLIGDDGEAPLPNAGLNLEVDDLEAATTTLHRLGGTLSRRHEPTQAMPVRVQLCLDPDGNAFELRQRVPVDR